MITFPTIFPVACHTDAIGRGSTFVVIRGRKEDGGNYIAKALEKGARLIVVERNFIVTRELEERIADMGATVKRVADVRKALADLSAQALDYPARRLKLIGITGTKGKTSTAFITEHILKTAGYRTALLSTVKNSIMGHDFSTHLTTQQPDYLNVFFKLCLDVGVEYVIMEVAAQALSLHRVRGLEFDQVLFSNFEPEHAEFYATVDDYFKAKCLLFNQIKSGGSILLNADDTWHEKIKVEHQKVQLFSLKRPHVDFYAQTKAHLNALTFTLVVGDAPYICMVPSLLGRFNVYNCLAAAALASNLGVDVSQIVAALCSFDAVPGRMQCHYLPNGSQCFIDYAHTPLSYKNVLSVLRHRTDHLIVVFGAGGDRDAGKRPIMGALVAEYADVMIITSDNPRSENAQAIVNQIIAGISSDDRYKLICEIDREQAIKKAYSITRPGSIIALLGKGADEYQIIGDRKIYFSEANILRSFKF